MSGLPHTLDNLYKKEKDKVLDMLKQLSELKKRCSALEKELNEKQLENQRLSGQTESMTHQLEAVQSKLIEYIELSKESQTQIEQLSMKLQRSDADKKILAARYRDSQAEITSLRDQIRQLRLKHEHIHADASVICRIITCDKSTNTFDTSLNLRDQAIQYPIESTFVDQLPPPSSSRQSTKYQTSMSYVAMDQTNYQIENSPEYSNLQTETDEDLTKLICMLNNL